MLRLFFLLLFCFTAVFTVTSAVRAERLALGGAAAEREIRRVESYFNNLDSLRARFSQINPDGSLSEGLFYFAPPSRMRFEYAPPLPYLLISTGRRFLYIDRDLQEISRLSLSDVPLGFLLRERVSLSGRDHRLDSIDIDAGVMVMKVALFSGDIGAIDLVFGLHPFQFWGWRMYSSDGGVIEVNLADIESGVELSDDLFRFRNRWERDR